MQHFKRLFSLSMCAALLFSACSCGTKPKATTTDTTSSGATAGGLTDAARIALLKEYQQDSTALKINSDSWKYDSENNVYYQIGIRYCSAPAAKDYETMGIFVPGAYFNGTKNSDRSYSCTVNPDGKTGSYTAKNAPIVFPVNTPDYSAQSAPTSYSYSKFSAYLKAGMIYVYAGMRGRENGYDKSGKLTYSGGAPWGVTDLKAAIRWCRFNSSALPGSTSSIFTFGMGGGGGQSALAGASGDSTQYFDYLTSIGSAMIGQDGRYISDSVCGSMCWCPITSFDYADEAYEWNMGQYDTTGTRAGKMWTAALSNDLAVSYAEYINKLGLKDEKGNALKLTATDNGVFTSGSYYNYLLTVIETSLNHFLNDTIFPYTPSNASNTSGNSTLTAVPSKSKKSGVTKRSPTTYKSAEDYIAALNSDTEWIKYDSKSNTVVITSIGAFVKHCKNAGKDVGAFDSTVRAQPENDLFGDDSSDKRHFDAVLSTLLKTNQAKYAKLSGFRPSLVTDYANDLKQLDRLKYGVQVRLNMYNPMYYLCSFYNGFGTSAVAPYWRIRTGIEQTDTALTVETNLALALKQYKTVKNVDFETVWGMRHTMAERKGDSTSNFISWVRTCVNT